MVDTAWVELSAVGDTITVVVSVTDTDGTIGFVVAGGPVDLVSGASGGLEVVVLAVVGMASDEEVLSVYVVVVDTAGGVVVSVISRGGGAAVVVLAAGIFEAMDSDMVTFFVVCQSVAAEVAGGAVVVSATWAEVDVSISGAVVVEVVSSVGVVCTILSVVTTATGGLVVSGVMYGVVLLMVIGATGVTDSVVFAEMTVGKVTVLVSTGGEVGRGEVVVEAVLGKPEVMGIVVVGGILSTVTGFVLVSVYNVVVVLGTVVLSVTVEVSETGAGPGLEVVPIGVTATECVVAFVVSSVGCTTAGGEVVMAVGPSMELVVGAVVVDGCRVVAVVVKSGFRESGGLVEEMSQNRAVIAKGALLVLDVLGWMVELTALVVKSVIPVTTVGWASVTLTVDSGSTTAGGAVGGAAVLERSGAAEGEVATGWVGSSGAGGAFDEVVCMLTAGTVVVILVVGAVCGEVEDVEVVVMVVLGGMAEVAELVMVAEVTAADVS